MDETANDEVQSKLSSKNDDNNNDLSDELENVNFQELESSLWETELEIALLTKCDYGTIRNIAKCRAIPCELRAKVWQICLDVQDKDKPLDKWTEVYDLPQQNKIRDDCQQLVEKLDSKMENEKKLLLVSDLESIVTYYCKTNDELYQKDNGWLEILHPLLTLKLKRNELYNLFLAILNRYVPQDCVRNGSPYHLFRLLLLYHDPELCAFLDTKKITPDSYAHLWVRSMFAGNCNLKVILHVWDVYFQLGDQFLIFFLSLVIVINSKEQIMSLKNADKMQIIGILQEASEGLNAEDIEDFCQLAQHYESKTPQSFRKEYQKPMFAGISLEEKACSIYQALCLPVSVSELLQANQLGTKGVRYFVVDCRPAEHYNNSHFATAFHLDANLMLENQTEFNHAVDALLDAQKQAISSGSIAGGEHLCFMGSGHDEEDKYVNMVVANFLQRKIKYISIALGGYETLAKCIEDPNSIIAMKDAIVSNKPDFNRAKFTEEWIKNIKTNNTSIFNKLSSVVKTKSVDFKGKFKNYMSMPSKTEANEYNYDYTKLTGFLSDKIKTYTPNLKNMYSDYMYPDQKHVSANDKIGKRYRNQANVFAIDDNDEDEDEVNKNDDDSVCDIVNLEQWLNKPDVLHKYKCFEVNDGNLLPAHLLVTNSHIYCLRELSSKKGMAAISSRRPLISLVKITSKKNKPELISFKYGNVINNNKNGSSQAANNEIESDISARASAATTIEKPAAKNEVEITAIDQFLIPEAGEASKAVKLQVIKILDLI